jgi:cytochrome b561
VLPLRRDESFAMNIFQKFAGIVFCFSLTLPALAELPAAKSPAAPPTSKINLKIDDLGFEDSALKVDTKLQADLNRRSSMLQTHQVLGIATAALMAATALTAPDDGPVSTAHKSLGIATGISYLTTAYFSLMAPEPLEGSSKDSWSMMIHKSLIYIHIPAMILTPIAGFMAENAHKKGREPSGLGGAKGALATTALVSFGVAALVVTINF